MKNQALQRPTTTATSQESAIATPLARVASIMAVADGAAGRSRRHDTPLLPEAYQPQTNLQATLTLITGVRAGQFVATDGPPVTIGRAPDSDLVVDDDTGVSRHHVRVGRRADGAFFAEDLGSTNGTFLGSQRLGLALLHGGDLLRLGPAVRVRFALVDAVELALRRRIYESSMHDPLTHVFNRQYLNDRLLAEIVRARSTRDDLAVLMIDVDNLKAINDLYGHLAGDRALCAIAARIQHVLRAGDVLARYGGDEFLVLVVGVVAGEEAPLAERVRRAVEGLAMSAQSRSVRITASIGLASLAEIDATDDPAGALIALADARMYTAKAAGKNRVSVVDPPYDRAAK